MPVSTKIVNFPNSPLDQGVGGSNPSRAYWNSFQEGSANWVIPTEWTIGTQTAFFGAIRLYTDGRVELNLSLYADYGGAPDPQFISEIEQFATFTVESLTDGVVTHTLVLTSTGDDTVEPYKWTPPNSQEVTDYVTGVFAQGSSGQTARLTIYYQAPAAHVFESEFSHDPIPQLDAQVSVVSHIEYNSEFVYAAPFSTTSSLSITPPPEITVGFITLGQTQNFLNPEYSLGGDSLETLSMFIATSGGYEKQYAPDNEVVQNHISTYLSLSEVVYRTLKDTNVVYEALSSAHFKLDAELRNVTGVEPRFFGFLMTHSSESHVIPLEYEPAEFNHDSSPQFGAQLSSVGDIDYRPTRFNHTPNPQLSAEASALGSIEHRSTFVHSPNTQFQSRLIAIGALTYRANFAHDSSPQFQSRLTALGISGYGATFNHNPSAQLDAQLNALGTLEYRSNFVHSPNTQLDAQVRALGDIDYRSTFNHAPDTQLDAQISAVSVQEHRATFEHDPSPQFDAQLQALGDIDYRSTYNHSPGLQTQAELSAVGDIDYRAAAFVHSPSSQFDSQLFVLDEINYNSNFIYDPSPQFDSRLIAIGDIEYSSNYAYTPVLITDIQYLPVGDIDYRAEEFNHSPNSGFDAQVTSTIALEYRVEFNHNPSAQFQSRLNALGTLEYRSNFVYSPNPVISVEFFAHSSITYRAYFRYSPSPQLTSTFVAGQAQDFRGYFHHTPSPNLDAQLIAIGDIEYESLFVHNSDPQTSVNFFATSIIENIGSDFLHSPNPQFEVSIQVFRAISYRTELHYNPSPQYDSDLVVLSELELETIARGKPVPSTTPDPKGILLRSFRVGITVRMKEAVKDNFWMVVGGEANWSTYSLPASDDIDPITDSRPPDTIRSQNHVSEPLVAVRATCDYVINDANGEFEHGVGVGTRWTILDTLEEARQRHCHHLLFRGTVDGDIITQDETFRQIGFYSGLEANEDYEDSDILLARHVRTYGFLESLIFRKPVNWEAGASQFSASVILIVT